MTKTCKSFLLVLWIGLLATQIFATDDHLLLCEAVVTPTSGEYIEITNPTASPVSLDNYFLSDDEDYALLPGTFGSGPVPAIGSSDFIVQFPPGSTIPSMGVVTVAFDGAGFFTAYAVSADYEIHGTDPGVTDMIPTMVGSATAGLTNSGENAVLFYWDGLTDLVTDIDMLNIGTPSSTNDIADKTGISVDGPDADTIATSYLADSFTMPQQVADPGFGFSTKRIFFEGSNETTGAGNGITGDDETTEDISVTWDDVFTAPDPGVCNAAPPLPPIIINEFLADPAAGITGDANGDGTRDGSQDEFVELLNTTSSDIDISGWTLADGALVRHTFPSGSVIGANCSLVLFGGGTPTGTFGGALVQTASTGLIGLTNSGDTIILNDGVTDQAVEVYGSEGGQNQSLTRDPDMTGSFVLHSTATTSGGALFSPGTLADGTGFSGCSILVIDVVINEILADPAADNTGDANGDGTRDGSQDEFVEIVNNDVSDLDISGWTLSDGASVRHTFPAGSVIPANCSIVVFGGGTPTGLFGGALVQTASTGLIGLNNGGDTVTLNDGSTDQATLTYGSEGANNQSLTRDPDISGPFVQHSGATGSGGALFSPGTQIDGTSFTGCIVSVIDVLINEILADPAADITGDANGDGTRDGSQDEFVEIVNNAASDLDISGWTLSDGFSVRHTFPAGSIVAANCSIVVFGGGTPTGPFGGALVQTASTGSLGLNNSGDTITLNDGSTDQAVFTYGSEGSNNQSLTRDPDITGAFVQHIGATGSGGASFSPGTQISGAPFSGCTAPALNVIINEVDADTAGTDVLEFIELYDGGLGNASLDGLVVVLYNGSNDLSYAAFDLDGYTTNANGYFVLGNSGVANVDLVINNGTIQNGADAVAVYEGDAVDFPNSTPVTAVNVMDALVYDTSDADDAGLLILLNPGQPQVNERGGGDSAAHSNQRCFDGTGGPRNTDTYTQLPPTPGLENICPAPLYEIFELQGNGLVSPFAGTLVRTENNVVTAVGPQGFCIQTPDARADIDTDTSNGIYVFTAGLPSVAVGDLVDVEGDLVEYYEFTEFTNAPTVTVLSSNNALPVPVVLDNTTPSPNQPQSSVEFERLEGMLVTIPTGMFISGNQYFGSDPYAEAFAVASLNRPFREPGIEYPGSAGLPVWDGNPEVFEMDLDRLLSGMAGTVVEGGQTFSATGVVGYDYGDYEVWPTAVTIDVGPPRAVNPVRDRMAGEITVGSQNLYRLFTDNSNPTYVNRLIKFSLQIRNVLKSPDVIAFQEVGGMQVLIDLAAQLQSDDSSLNYTPYLELGNDVGGIEVGFLVRDTIVVNSVTQIMKNDIFTYNNVDSLLHDRPPLILDATYQGGATDFNFLVMVVHNRSLNNIDDPADGDRVRNKRHEQALSIANHIQGLQASNLLVVGDFNGFEFTDGYVDVLGQITGNLDPLGAMIPGTDVVNPDLTNLVLSLPLSDRYSYNYRGNAQALDHALANQSLMCAVRGMAYGRSSSDFAKIFYYDVSTERYASDHDGLVVYLQQPSILVNPVAGLITSESGAQASFDVVLTSAPSANVSLGVSSGDATEGSVDMATLVFSPFNWDQPQTVVVTGLPDIFIDGDITYQVILAPAVSTDACYAGMDPADVEVTNLDANSAGILVSPINGLLTDESGSTDSFNVVLNSSPSNPVTVPLSVSDPGEISLATASLVFDSNNWDQPQTVVVTGVDDGTIDADQFVDVLLGLSQSADANYQGIDPQDVEVLNVNIQTSDDYTIDIGVDCFLEVWGPPNGSVGIYTFDEATQTWVFLMTIVLDGNGYGSVQIECDNDVIYGAGGPNGDIPPDNTGFHSVPTLGTWSLIFFVLAMMFVAIKTKRN